MIGLDTNVLIRHVTQDDPVQSLRANALIEDRLTEDEPGFISVVALTETVWVLDRVYKYSDVEVASVIERFLQTRTFIVENEMGKQLDCIIDGGLLPPDVSSVVSLIGDYPEVLRQGVGDVSWVEG